MFYHNFERIVAERRLSDHIDGAEARRRMIGRKAKVKVIASVWGQN